MSLGKDSIQKRVAKPAEAAPAPKDPAREAPAKRSPGRPRVKTAVVTNIAPETVEKVAKAGGFSLAEKYALGRELPYYLL